MLQNNLHTKAQMPFLSHQKLSPQELSSYKWYQSRMRNPIYHKNQQNIHSDIYTVDTCPNHDTVMYKFTNSVSQMISKSQNYEYC